MPVENDTEKAKPRDLSRSDSHRRQSITAKHRASVLPQIEILKRQRDELRRRIPEVIEAERLRKEIEILEREEHTEQKHERQDLKLKKVKSRDGVKFFARPKIRAYFRGAQLFRSTGDHEYAATTSISLFTDLLFVGVLAETGALINTNNGVNLMIYIVQFLPSWRIWCYVRDIVAIRS